MSKHYVHAYRRAFPVERKPDAVLGAKVEKESGSTLVDSLKRRVSWLKRTTLDFEVRPCRLTAAPTTLALRDP